jgi:hypothetical protein
MRWSWFRLAAAAVGVSGVVAGYVVNVDRATRQGQDLGLVLANYFSLFTIVSSTLTAVALTAAAIWTMRHPAATREPFAVALGLAIVTGPMILLGVVFNLLLRGAPSAEALADSSTIHFLDQWATETLHVVLPLYLLIDLLFAVKRRGLPWSSLVILAAYPIVWIIYTMIRGELVPNPDGSAQYWYPYFFLNPHGDAGWSGAFTYIAVLTAAVIAIGAGVIAIGRFRERRAARREPAAAEVSVLQD